MLLFLILKGNKDIFKEPFSLPTSHHLTQQQSIGLQQSASSVLLDTKKEAPGTTASNLVNQITPCSTPNQKRKDTNRRRSNLFTVFQILEFPPLINLKHLFSVLAE